MIQWLQNWYLAKCDGDWEHEFGISIETLDNPGWMVTIDLSNTILEGIEIPYTLLDKADNDWIGYSIVSNVFKGSGDPKKLMRIIEEFKGIWESHLEATQHGL
jgi:hypothetical protein